MRRLLDDLLLLARADAESGNAPAATPRSARSVRLDEIAAEAVRSAEALASGQVLELEAPRGVEMQRRRRPPPPTPDDPARQRHPAYPARGRIRVAVAATSGWPGAHRRPRRRGRDRRRSTCRTSSSGSIGPMGRVAALQEGQDWGWPSPRPSFAPTAARSPWPARRARARRSWPRCRAQSSSRRPRTTRAAHPPAAPSPTRCALPTEPISRAG